jgi:sugar phosphate isomerase/epimerase
MKFAISNISLKPIDHLNDIEALAEMGFQGLEVALSRVFAEDWNNPSSVQVDAYRNGIETMGLSIIGLHSLFWNHPEYTMFGDINVKNKTLDFLVNLSAVCRDLGGKSLIYGSQTARTKGQRTMGEANAEAADFFGLLCKRIEGHDTCFCLEPLESKVADYVHSVLESQALVKSVNHPGLRVQIDAKAMAAANEIQLEIFKAVRNNLAHVHVNEPGFKVLGTSGFVDHKKIGACLKDIEYEGYVSIEQKMNDETNPLISIRKSARILMECYA